MTTRHYLIVTITLPTILIIYSQKSKWKKCDDIEPEKCNNIKPKKITMSSQKIRQFETRKTII